MLRQRGDVDVALCDIKMPDGNGIDLVRSTRAAGLDTPFLIMTAFASVETAVEALRAGASDYITKPVRGEEVLHRVAAMASGGMDNKIDSVRPPDCRPKCVPRSHTRLNST